VYPQQSEVSRMFATVTPAIGRASVRTTAGYKLNWLGFTIFGLLMTYPFVAHFIPSWIREYLSASLR
jgi:hypothetical protein